MAVNPGSLVTEDGGQELSNKTLASPVLNSPTVTGPFRTEIDTLQSDVDTLQSQVSTLQSQVSALQAIDHSHGYVILSTSSSVTPVANTPTSNTISGIGLDSGTYNAAVTANTTVIGSDVKGVATTDVTSSSMKVWVYRTNTTSTGVDVLMVQAGDPLN